MTTYYVSTTGSNSSSGSEASPFRSINHAVNYSGLKPGDTIIVKPGTYTEQVVMQKDGAANGYITLQSEVPGQALIRPPSGGYSTVSIRADYVVVDGFDVQGGSGHGIDAESVHHTVVRNNTVHDSGGSGIQYNYSEFITIEGNTVYNNASTNGYQCSGISIYQNRNITGDTTTGGFRTIVRGNVSHDNVTTATNIGEHTDGNGIIIDDFQSTQNGSFSSYTYPTLVENNLVYENGGKGVQVTWSDYVTVRNNTAYHNNQDNLNPGTWRAELSNQQSSNNTWINNIAIADSKVNSNNTAVGNYSSGGYVNKGTQWFNNVTFNGTVGQASVKLDGGNTAPSAANGNLLGVDPKFVSASSGNFALQSGSAAIDAGTAKYGLATTDLDGHTRAVGTVDIGTYEAGFSNAGIWPSSRRAP
jgi:parallel beta-helix repeat protein